MNWLPFKKEEKFALVKIFILKNVRAKKEFGVLYFYLYEDRNRNRKYEHQCSIVSNNDFSNISNFQEKVYPWLQGVDFSDIPSYWGSTRETKKEQVKQLYKLLLKK